MGEQKLKWGADFYNTGAFLLGANINMGDGCYYLCLYFGKWTLVIGKNYFTL